MNTLQTLRAAAQMLAAQLSTPAPHLDVTGEGTFDHSDFEALLDAHSRDGRVDYAGFDRAALDAYVTRLAEADPEELASEAQLTFWINAYNALAIRSVLERYPISSVHEVPEFFTRRHSVGRRALSLNQIEHGIVRRYGDPRVHAALVCAAGSCPVPTAYRTGDLAAQLDARMRAFLGDPARGARYDVATDTLYLSRIFQWFAGDFSGLGAHLDPRRLAPALRSYLDGPALAATEAGRIAWMEYDWGLNDER
ncbi:MAG: hypothetical protein RLZZ387_4453 [Chloroflexota bacterium]|jgi:hypothetical protein